MQDDLGNAQFWLSLQIFFLQNEFQDKPHHKIQMRARVPNKKPQTILRTLTVRLLVPVWRKPPEPGFYVSSFMQTPADLESPGQKSIFRILIVQVI